MCVSARPVRVAAARPFVDGSDVQPSEKVLYFVRHGEGDHNVAAATSAFKCDCDSVAVGATGNCPCAAPGHLVAIAKRPR